MRIRSWIVILLSPGVLGNPFFLLSAEEDTGNEDEDALIEEFLRGDDLAALAIPDLEDILPPLPLWDMETILKAGGGYRDNVRRGTFQPEGSSFLLAGFETMLLRLPPEGPRLTVFLETEHLEFLSGDDLPSDTFVSAFSQLSFPQDTGVTTTFGLAGFYLDQVVDVATFQVPVEPIPVRGFGLTPSISVRKDWPTDFFVETSAAASRQMFEKPIHDFWEYGPKLSAGWSPAKSEVSLSVEYLERDYDDRPAFSAEGAEMPGTNVGFRILRPQMNIRHTWGENRRWRSNTRFGFEFNRDDESNYFAYDLMRISQQLEFRHLGWDLKGRLRYSLFKYKLQEVDENGSKKRRHSWGAGLEARRELSEHFDLFVRYDREWVDSNEEDSDYSVDTWIVGLGWKF